MSKSVTASIMPPDSTYFATVTSPPKPLEEKSADRAEPSLAAKVERARISSVKRVMFIFAESRVATSSREMPINFPRLALVSSSNGDAASPPSAEALILGISAQTGAKRIPTSRSPSGACSAKESREDQSFTCESSSGVMVARVQPPWSTIASLKFSACLRTGLSSLNLTARTNVGSSPPSSSKTNKVMDAFASMEVRAGSPNAMPANTGNMAICGSGFTVCATATAFCKSFGNAMVFT